MSRDLFFRRRHRRYVQRRLFLVSMMAVLAGLLFHNSCRVAPVKPVPQYRDEPIVTVRVSLPKAPTLSVSGAYEIYRGEPKGTRGELVARGGGLAGARLLASGSGVRVGGDDLPSWVEVVPAIDGAVVIGKTSYRGSMFLGLIKGKLAVVNRVPIERYLQGVLGGEMPLSWQDSALEAQAIAARTYALYELSFEPRSPYFDLYDSQASQVYKGTTHETDRSRDIVHRCRGVVMTWVDKPFKAFFHSTCGGHTADALSVFPENAVSPLAGRPCKLGDADLCAASSVHRWTREFGSEALARRISKRLGRRITKIHDIRVVRPSGRRVESVVVLHEGPRLELSAYRFRMLIGAGRDGLLSTDFDVELTGGKIVFKGRGWGHGVGLCQYGAKGLADAGQGGQDIAGFYYPGAAIVKLWE